MAAPLAAQQPLPRKGVFGALLAPLSDSVRAAHRLAAADSGTVLVSITPGSTASGLDLRSGDLLLAINGGTVPTPARAVGAIGSVPAGAPIAVRFSRSGRTMTATGTMQPRLLERTATWETIADEVTVDGRRRRVLITRPLAPGRHPTLFFIGGIGGYSLDGLLDALQVPYGHVLKAFADAGWATVRVDKPGQGDSEGGAITELLFDDELAGYRAALGSLHKHAFIDTGRVVLFGHSMGGSHGPILASEAPWLRGIAVYGTLGVTWPEYWLSTLRRQYVLGGVPAGTAEQLLKDQARITHHIFNDGMTPAEVAAAKPDLAAAVQNGYGAGNTISGMGVPFFRQLHARNIAEHWAALRMPVLVMAGESDFVASREDHPIIADIVNAAHPGTAEYRLLPAIDHWLNRRASYAESRAGMGQPGAFNPVINEALLDWARKVTQ